MVAQRLQFGVEQQPGQVAPSLFGGLGQVGGRARQIVQAKQGYGQAEMQLGQAAFEGYRGTLQLCQGSHRIERQFPGSFEGAGGGIGGGHARACADEQPAMANDAGRSRDQLPGVTVVGEGGVGVLLAKGDIAEGAEVQGGEAFAIDVFAFGVDGGFEEGLLGGGQISAAQQGEGAHGAGADKPVDEIVKGFHGDGMVQNADGRGMLSAPDGE